MKNDLLWLITSISLLMMILALAWALNTTIGDLNALEARVTAMETQE